MDSKLHGPNRTKFGEDTGPSPVLNNFVLDFTRVTLFPNEGASKATGVKNRGQISDLFTPEKLIERCAKCQSVIFN